MKSLEVYNLEGKVVDRINLDPEIFDGKVNQALLWELVKMYLANKRQGTASTKTRGERRGGGAKPWPQKGTGRARAGSIRSPIFRKGGVVFGPKPRNYHYKVPQKKKALGLKSALNQRVNEARLKLIEVLEVQDHKTKNFYKILEKLGIKEKCLIIDTEFSENLKLASRNIEFVELERAQNLNAYQVLSFKRMLITKKALVEICERIKRVLNKNKIKVKVEK